MHEHRSRRIAFGAALVALGGLLVPAAARAGDETEKQVVKKKVVIKNCAGDDCEERRIHRRVFVSEDGELKELGGHGGHHWIGSMHGGKGGFLGVHLTELTPELREHFGVPGSTGVMVSKVVADTPASRADLRVGDIITAFGGEAVASGSALAAAIRGRGEGESVALEVYRDRLPLEVTAQVEVREGPARQARVMFMDCEDTEDCDFQFDFESGLDFDFDFETGPLTGLDCGGGPCKIEVECEDGACECTANGESVDCAAIPGAHPHPG